MQPKTKVAASRLRQSSEPEFLWMFACHTLKDGQQTSVCVSIGHQPDHLAGIDNNAPCNP